MSDETKPTEGETPDTPTPEEEASPPAEAATSPAETEATAAPPETPIQPGPEEVDAAALAANLSQEDTVKLVSFVQDEIKKAKRGVAMTYTFGIVLGFILAGYLGSALYQLNQTVLNPTLLAQFIGDTAEEQAPQLVAELETFLVESAEEQANELSAYFLETAPQVFASAREQIDWTHEVYLPALSEEFSSVMREYIEANGPAIEEFAAAHSDDEFAAYFVDSLIEELELTLNDWMRENFEGRDLAYAQENLRLGMLAMNEKLNELVYTDPENLNRRERMQRRVLARLYRSVAEAIEAQEMQELSED